MKSLEVSTRFAMIMLLTILATMVLSIALVCTAATVLLKVAAALIPILLLNACFCAWSWAVEHMAEKEERKLRKRTQSALSGLDDQLEGMGFKKVDMSAKDFLNMVRSGKPMEEVFAEITSTADIPMCANPDCPGCKARRAHKEKRIN